MPRFIWVATDIQHTDDNLPEADASASTSNAPTNEDTTEILTGVKRKVEEDKEAEIRRLKAQQEFTQHDTHWAEDGNLLLQIELSASRFIGVASQKNQYGSERSLNGVVLWNLDSCSLTPQTTKD